MKITLSLLCLFVFQVHAQQSPWNFVKTTEVDGTKYDTFQNPDGDQAVVKRRTPRTVD